MAGRRIIRIRIRTPQYVRRDKLILLLFGSVALCLCMTEILVGTQYDVKAQTTTTTTTPTLRIQQQRRRLCTSEEVRHGSWVPVTLSRPPFIPRHSKCYSQEQLQNDGTDFPYYHWHPSADCEFTQWDPKLFCHLANNKTIGIMGDSLSWEQFASLAGMLGLGAGAHNELSFVGDDGKKYSQQEPFRWDVCDGTAKIGFYRNRYLMYPRWFLHVVDPDIMIFNRGAHYVDTKTLVNGWREKQNESGMTSLIDDVHKFQKKCDNEGRDCLTLWRTTSPGHPLCQNFTHPAKSVQEMEDYIRYEPWKYPGGAHRYNWWEFKNMNNLIVGMIKNASTPSNFNFDVIPGYDINILRPDAHVSASDCLHNCDPGAADVYNALLLHLMRLHYENDGGIMKSM